MIQNTLRWYEGEMFEGRFILAFGVLLIVSAFLFYFLGNTAAARALLTPFVVIGIFFSATGLTMNFSNAKKAEQAKQRYTADAKAFVDAEIIRVEGFQYLYPMSIGISLAVFLMALAFLYFSKNVHLHAIAMALILFGTAFAMIDYFSKERVNTYYESLRSFKG